MNTVTGRLHIHWYAQVFGIYDRCFCGHGETRQYGLVLLSVTSGARWMEERRSAARRRIPERPPI
jgi:hypothetical protein